MCSPSFHLALIAILSISNLESVTAARRLVNENANENAAPRQNVYGFPDESIQPDPPEGDDVPPTGADGDPEGDRDADLFDVQFTDDPLVDKDVFEMIINGEVSLTELMIGHSDMDPNNEELEGEAYGVSAEFCQYDPELNALDPTAYTKSANIMIDAEHCSQHSYDVEVMEVMALVNEHDDRPQNKVDRLPVTGFIFHEGYSGAGVLSNALTALEDARVISEHPALRDALGSCDVIQTRYQEACDPALREKLVKDVITLLSRVDGQAKGLTEMYIKLDADSGAYIKDLISWYPHAKWVYVYREPMAALEKATTEHQDTCKLTKRLPSEALKAKADAYEVDLESLTKEEICALHLATLTDEAAKELEVSNNGKLVDYDTDINHDNPEKVVEEIISHITNQKKVNPATQKKMMNTLGLRSNPQGKINASEKWDADDERRKLRGQEVSEEVRAASVRFMSDSRVLVEKLRAL